MWRSLPVCVAVAAAFSAGWADSLTIGSVVLRLGRPKSQVLPELGKKYSLQPNDSNGQSFMARDNESVYAAVVFDEHGELVTATKYWLPELRDYNP